MLPTTGFFKKIDCPYHEVACDRPYCHYKHRKRNEESAGTSQGSTEVPTYNPTPKSELANARTHIPISYVPDLAVRKERSNIGSFPSFGYSDMKPTYKPTPLSVLSTTKATPNNSTDSTADQEECSEDGDDALQEDNYDINFDDLEVDLEMLTDIINEANANEVKAEEEKKQTNGESSVIAVEVADLKVKEKSKDKKVANGSHRESRSSKKSASHSKKEKTESHKKRQEDAHKKSSDKKSDSKHSSESSKNSSKHKSSSSSRDKSKHKHKSKSKERKKEHGEKNKVVKQRSNKVEVGKIPDILANLNKSDGFDNHSDNDASSNYFENDSDLDEDPMAECYKIFTEYKPTQPSIIRATIKEPALPEPEVPETVINKKRIAHDNAEKTRQNSIVSKPKLATAAQVMTNRFKLARLQSITKEENTDIVAEISKQLLKRPAEVELHKSRLSKLKKSIPKVPPVKPSTSGSLIDDIITGRPTLVKPKRIAPVQNVNSIQRAKAKIEELAKIKAANAVNKTLPQTAKGVKRVAHVPEFSNADIPDVIMAERSKLPVNVRSRFLKTIFEECIKLYFNKQEAQDRALNEEYKCYERCSALVTYRNSAMLAVSRLRKELQEREVAGLGPIMPGDGASVKSDTLNKGAKFYENIKRFILTDEELTLHGFPREGSTPGKAIIKNPRKVAKQVSVEEGYRICCRCAKHYRIDKHGFALYDEECIYHPLKKRTFRGDSIYLCCKSSSETGCASSNTHVSETNISSDDEFEGYQTTMAPEYEDDPRNHQVFALDCEMCYTTKGLELTRVTIVNSDCKTVYETLVKPLNPIIDYNTRFSGITEEQMERTATSILQVQANILHLCNSNTILIGHSLESDMKALKIIHSSVIDTSVMFPHKFGLPQKRALRDLAREFLNKIIQNDVSGHDSAEDALTCMELLKWKLKEDFKTRGIKL